MPYFEVDLEMSTEIFKLVAKFEDSFGHINPGHILPVMVSEVKDPPAYAEVRKVPMYMRTVSPYRVAMMFYEENFADLPLNVKRMVIVHELEHIQPHPKMESEYTLKKHDVQDWTTMVNLLGPNWASKMEDYDIDISRIESGNWRDALVLAAHSGLRKKARRAGRRRSAKA